MCPSDIKAALALLFWPSNWKFFSFQPYRFFFPFVFFSHCEKTMDWVQVLILFAENVALAESVNLWETQSWGFASLERLLDLHRLSVKLNEHQSCLAQVLASLLFPLLSIPLGMTSKRDNFPDENCRLKPSVPSFHTLKCWTEQGLPVPILLSLLFFCSVGSESWMN